MSRDLLDEVMSLLDTEGLQPASTHIHTDDGSHAEAIHSLQMAIQGKHGSWQCMIRVFSQTQRIVVYSLLPDVVPDSERLRLAQMLSRINYGLVLGNFELDLDDGEVRYKTSLDAEDMTLNLTILRNLVYGNFFGMDLYIRALQTALQNPEDPVEALIAEAEGEESSGSAFNTPTSTMQ